MEIILILGVTLGILLLLEIWNYNKFIEAAESLNTMGNSMMESFKGVSRDIVLVNVSLEEIGARITILDTVTDSLNSNDALIAVYLDLFRDALQIDPDKLSRVGTIKLSEPKS